MTARLSRRITAVVCLLLVAFVAYRVLAIAVGADGRDVSAYWGAAMRLREGAPLYEPGSVFGADVYRYTPWFAYAWVPLTFLPRDAVEAAWVACMLAAAFISTAPLLNGRLAGIVAFVLITPFQVEGAAYGNVQPLLVLMLVWGAERRSGPLWIALAASLKAVPAVLALVYLARGETKRGLVALGLTAVLCAPTFFHDLSGYSTLPGSEQMSLMTLSPVVFVIVGIAATAGVVLLARTRYAWLAGGIAAMAWLPRLLSYEIGFVLVGLAPRWSRAMPRLRLLPAVDPAPMTDGVLRRRPGPA